MSDVSFKEKCRLFYVVKGHIAPNDQTVIDSYDGYFRRMWNNNEAYVHEEGFEEEYNRVFMMGTK